MKKWLLIGLTVMILQSCDCWVLIDGQVIDSNSKEPIKKAWVEFTNVKCTEKISSTVATEIVNCIFVSDSIGAFFMKSNSYGICPNGPFKIRVRKSGYKTKELELDENNIITDLIVELEKE